MKIKLSIILIFLSVCIYAQEINQFTHSYPSEYSMYANDMHIYSNSYYITGAAGCFNPLCNTVLQGIHITKINDEGELQYSEKISRCNWAIGNGYGCFDITESGEFVLAGIEYSDTSYNNNLFISKLTEDFDTIVLVKLYEDTLSKRFWHMSSCRDGGYIIVGGVDSTHSEYSYPDMVFTQTLLIKLDSLFEPEWIQSYYFADSYDQENYQYGTKVIQTWDNGYMVLGRHFNNEHFVYAPFVMKTDSLGNMEWKQIFYSTGWWDAPPITDIIETRDSCYIFCGSKAVNAGWAGEFPFDGWLRKFDINHQLVWQKFYREHNADPVAGTYDSIHCQFYSLCELPDRNIAVAGNSKKVSFNNLKWPSLFLLDSEGDSITSKHYFDFPVEHPDFVNYAYPNSIVSTEDGGVAIAGWGEYRDLETGQWFERIFLIKTDSLGNDIYTYSLPPCELEDMLFSVYPNPAKDVLNIDYNMPNRKANLAVYIYDINGRLLKTYHLTQAAGYVKLDVSNLSSGNYIVSIGDKSGKYAKQIVIE